MIRNRYNQIPHPVIHYYFCLRGGGGGGGGIRSLTYCQVSFSSVFYLLRKIQSSEIIYHLAFEPPRDKTNKMTMRPAKTQISLGIRPV